MSCGAYSVSSRLGIAYYLFKYLKTEGCEQCPVYNGWLNEFKDKKHPTRFKPNLKMNPLYI